jgi:hypothetical protein
VTLGFERQLSHLQVSFIPDYASFPHRFTTSQTLSTCSTFICYHLFATLPVLYKPSAPLACRPKQPLLLPRGRLDISTSCIPETFSKPLTTLIMAAAEQPYDPYIPAGSAGAAGGSAQNGNQRTAALQAVSPFPKPNPPPDFCDIYALGRSHMCSVVDGAYVLFWPKCEGWVDRFPDRD